MPEVSLSPSLPPTATSYPQRVAQEEQLYGASATCRHFVVCLAGTVCSFSASDCVSHWSSSGTEQVRTERLQPVLS